MSESSVTLMLACPWSSLERDPMSSAVAHGRLHPERRADRPRLQPSLSTSCATSAAIRSAHHRVDAVLDAHAPCPRASSTVQPPGAAPASCTAATPAGATNPDIGFQYSALSSARSDQRRFRVLDPGEPEAAPLGPRPRTGATPPRCRWTNRERSSAPRRPAPPPACPCTTSRPVKSTISGTAHLRQHLAQRRDAHVALTERRDLGQVQVADGGIEAPQAQQRLVVQHHDLAVGVRRRSISTQSAPRATAAAKRAACSRGGRRAHPGGRWRRRSRARRPPRRRRRRPPRRRWR